MSRTNDETTHLRALLADATARAERAESYAGKLEIDVSGFKGTISEQVDRIHTEMARADQALAANAELRAALDAIVDENPCDHFDHHGNCQTHSQCDKPCANEVARQALSRPDLGAGMVVVERGMLERCRKILWANRRVLDNVLLADLDALLKKGGE